MYQAVAERTNFKTKLVALGGISTQNMTNLQVRF
jgi:hypothetical protein